MTSISGSAATEKNRPEQLIPSEVIKKRNHILSDPIDHLGQNQEMIRHATALYGVSAVSDHHSKQPHPRLQAGIWYKQQNRIVSRPVESAELKELGQYLSSLSDEETHLLLKEVEHLWTLSRYFRILQLSVIGA